MACRLLTMVRAANNNEDTSARLGRRCRRRTHTLGVAVFAATLSTARPRLAGARGGEAPAAALDSDGAQVRLLEDPEVGELRRLQQSIRLYDTRRKAFVKLPELLKPGEQLYEADAVCIGELHDSPVDHTMQRVIIDALTYRLFLDLRASQGVDPAKMTGTTSQNASPKRIAVGMEYFSRQQKRVLDEFVFGGFSGNGERETLADFRKASDWDTLWNYDWKLYAPLFRFCQLNATRLIGLNIPYEAVRDVSRSGLEAQPEWLRELLPELDLSKRKHRRRFEDMFRMPLEDAVGRMALSDENFTPDPKLNTMYEGQTLWDEYMAQTANQYLDARAGRLIILAGINHSWRDAIPDRLEARAKLAGRTKQAVTIIPWRRDEDVSYLSDHCDYIWCHKGDGGGIEIAEAMQAQRQRLAGKSRVFPAGYL